MLKDEYLRFKSSPNICNRSHVIGIPHQVSFIAWHIPGECCTLAVDVSFPFAVPLTECSRCKDSEGHFLSYLKSLRNVLQILTQVMQLICYSVCFSPSKFVAW